MSVIQLIHAKKLVLDVTIDTNLKCTCEIKSKSFKIILYFRIFFLRILPVLYKSRNVIGSIIMVTHNLIYRIPSLFGYKKPRRSLYSQKKAESAMFGLQ